MKKSSEATKANIRYGQTIRSVDGLNLASSSCHVDIPVRPTATSEADTKTVSSAIRGSFVVSRWSRTRGSPSSKQQTGGEMPYGKVAAITGAATGIGRAIALDYLRHGARVAINHYPDQRSEQQFREMLDEAGQTATDLLIAVPGDVSDPETGQRLVQRAVAKFGRLDVFVSNAGICEFADFLT
nr:l-rhamnose-1-dehydrogenase [Quercus suber]